MFNKVRSLFTGKPKEVLGNDSVYPEVFINEDDSWLIRLMSTSGVVVAEESGQSSSYDGAKKDSKASLAKIQDKYKGDK